MKKIILILLVLAITGCSSEVTKVKNPDGNSLTYKYFTKENYEDDKYNLKLKNDNSIITVIKDNDNLYYGINGGMNLIIIEKEGLRYNFDLVNQIYSTESIVISENYTEGILPESMKKLKDQSYKTGKEKINSHKYVFETYKYSAGTTTYYFDDDELKFIKKQTDEEDLLYEVLKFSTKVKDSAFEIPEGYTEMTY